jgi:hypothetical protein
MIRGRAATPAHNKLFKIRDKKEAKKLNKEHTGTSFPPHSGATVVHGHEGKMGYTNCSVFPYNEGKEPRRR